MQAMIITNILGKNDKNGPRGSTPDSQLLKKVFKVLQGEGAGPGNCEVIC